jgi:hypothetical protein
MLNQQPNRTKLRGGLSASERGESCDGDIRLSLDVGLRHRPTSYASLVYLVYRVSTVSIGSSWP